MMKESVSAGGVVLNPDGKVLVINQHGTSWSLPKGLIEKGEDALAAARREIYEESGIRDVNVVKKLGHYQRHRINIDGTIDTTELKTIHMFLFTTQQTTIKPIDPDNPEARWVDKHDVKQLLTHQKDQEFFENMPCLPPDGSPYVFDSKYS